MVISLAIGIRLFWQSGCSIPTSLMRSVTRGRPMVCLYTTSQYKKQPFYTFPLPIPLAWKENTFQHKWHHLEMYIFHPFTLMIHRVTNHVRSVGCLLWPHREWFLYLLSLLVTKSLRLLQVQDLLMQPHNNSFTVPWTSLPLNSRLILLISDGIAQNFHIALSLPPHFLSRHLVHVKE